MSCVMSVRRTPTRSRRRRGLDELATISPEFRTTGEKQQFLLRVARVKARLVAEELRVLAAADDIAEATGDRSTATWLATQTRDNHGAVRRQAALASALDSRWTRTADALSAGEVNLAQARIIVESLEALPTDVGDDLIVKAEAYLVEQAQQFGPQELRNLGRGVLETSRPRDRRPGRVPAAARRRSPRRGGYQARLPTQG